MPSPDSDLRLTALKRGQSAVVAAVIPTAAADPIAQRLIDLGFVPGESVRVSAQGPIAREPLLVQIGNTRFALRHAEAQRIKLEPQL